MDSEALIEGREAKAQACKTSEELVTLAKEGCARLDDATLEGISGGGRPGDPKPPHLSLQDKTR